MGAGPMGTMGAGLMWGGPIIRQQQLNRPQRITNRRNGIPTTGTTARTRKATTRMSKVARAAG